MYISSKHAMVLIPIGFRLFEGMMIASSIETLSFPLITMVCNPDPVQNGKRGEGLPNLEGNALPRQPFSMSRFLHFQQFSFHMMTT